MILRLPLPAKCFADKNNPKIITKEQWLLLSSIVCLGDRNRQKTSIHWELGVGCTTFSQQILIQQLADLVRVVSVSCCLFDMNRIQPLYIQQCGRNGPTIKVVMYQYYWNASLHAKFYKMSTINSHTEVIVVVSYYLVDRTSAQQLSMILVLLLSHHHNTDSSNREPIFNRWANLHTSAVLLLLFRNGLFS